MQNCKFTTICDWKDYTTIFADIAKIKWSARPKWAVLHDVALAIENYRQWPDAYLSMLNSIFVETE